MKVTIAATGYSIYALDESGKIVARRKRYCNSAALHQLILDVAINGAEIDWKNSQVAKPDVNLESNP